MAAQRATASATDTSTTATESEASSTSTSAPAPVASATSSTAFSSQVIAQSVLGSGPKPAQPLSSDMSKLAAALSSGAGVPENPIVVTLSERKCPSSRDFIYFASN